VILPLAVSAATLVGGVAATYCYDRRTPLAWRIASGACTGLAALGLIGFCLAMRFGLTARVVAIAGILTAAPTGLLFLERYRRPLLRDLAAAVRAVPTAFSGARARDVVSGVLYAAGALLLWRVADRAMFVRSGAIYTGVSHNLGDLPFHLTVTSRFVHGGNFPPEHPSFAGAGFTYPFLTDFLGGMFVVAGVPMREVIVCSTFLLCAAVAGLLYRWTLELTGNRAAALIAPALALFSGGLGWWMFVVEAWERGGVWELLARLPHDYTITHDGAYRWGNLVTSLLVTQRGLLLGLPLAIIIFRLWWDAPADDAGARRSRMIAAGVIAGMLPLVHAHSFAVVLGVGGCLAILSADRWAWVPFFAWSLALGLPQVWWVTRASGVEGQAFLAWSVGWDRGGQNVVTFWLENTGAFGPLLAVALLWPSIPPRVPRALGLFYLPFLMCFIVPNLVRLAPWIWDNIKVLVYWFIASVPLVALVLGQWVHGTRWRRPLAVALLIVLMLAGALDLWRVASGAFEARIFDRAGIEFAGMVADRTSAGSLILHAPIPNHPIGLSGRRSLMGYPGHVWSHGLDPGPRQADIRRMYAGGEDASALLARYGIDYVVIGPDERFKLSASERFFDRFPRVAEAGGYRLYRIRDDRPR
jgi:hypothetical protein